MMVWFGSDFDSVSTHFYLDLVREATGEPSVDFVVLVVCVELELFVVVFVLFVLFFVLFVLFALLCMLLFLLFSLF
jgi:hypothetical protein